MRVGGGESVTCGGEEPACAAFVAGCGVAEVDHAGCDFVEREVGHVGEVDDYFL